MIKKFVEAWFRNRKKLREIIKEDKKLKYCDYNYLVKLLFEWVINPYYHDLGEKQWNENKIREIDDGDYQGTRIFIVYQDWYQPTTSNYCYTSVYYGSCSVCDTLEGIQSESYEDIPTKSQVNQYMALCLHLLENCRLMKDEDYDKD